MPTASTYIFLAILLIAIVGLSVFYVWVLLLGSAKRDETTKSCVSINYFGKFNSSGFFCQIEQDIFIVTCKHCVTFPVLFIRDIKGRRIRAEEILVAKDGRDVAFIRFKKPDFEIYPLQFHKDVATLTPGQEISSYGDSLGEKVFVKEEGKILGIGPIDIEINNPIVHGNSGGPVLLKGSNLVIAIASRRGEVRKDEESQLSNKGTRFENVRRFAVRFDDLKLDDMLKTEWGKTDEKDAQSLNKLARESLVNGDIDTYRLLIDYNASQLNDPLALNIWYELVFEGLFLNNKYKETPLEELAKNLNNISTHAYSLNIPAAKLDLGFMLLYGILTTADPAKGFQLVHQAAESGYMVAQWYEGYCYAWGIGTVKNPQKALEYFQKAALKDYSRALNDLGNCYLQGFGTLRNNDLAKVCFQKSAELNDCQGLFMMGVFTTNTDLAKAITYYCRAAQLGHIEASLRAANFYYGQKDYRSAAHYYNLAANKQAPLAIYSLAIFYKFGLGGYPKDNKEEIKLLKQAANLENPEAMTLIGNYYRKGYDSLIVKNINEAIIWFGKASEKGNLEARHNLGELYLNGECGEPYLKNAFAFFKSASEGNYIASFSKLAFCYLNGLGTEKDLNQAIFWLEKSANAGIPEGQRIYADCFIQGLGIERDFQKAFKLYDLAAKGEDAEAMTKLADMYYSGFESVLPDYAKAAEWYNKAYLKGDQLAAYKLGLLFYDGKGVEKNLDQARTLFLYAWETGHIEKALAMLQNLQKTPSVGFK